jgi:hypothetical protein
MFEGARVGDRTHWEWNGPVLYSDPIELALPRIMRSRDITARFLDEVKFNHRWFGVLASHIDDQPRVFRVFVLWCRTLMVGFLLALIFRNADLVGQNSCEDHLTSDSCTAASAFIGLGSQKCNWRTIPRTEQFDNQLSIDGYCIYIQAEDSFGRIFFVAMFVALVIVPWSMLVHFLTMKVLASGHGTVNKIVPLTGDMNDLDAAMERDLRVKPASVDSSYKMNRFGRKEKMKRAISYSKSEGFEFSNKVIDVDFESMQEFNSVVAQIRAEDNTALIDAWRLDTSDGEYFLKKKLKSCRNAALKEKMYFNSSYVSNIDKGNRLTYLFINDFVSMNAISSKILDSAYRKEHYIPYVGVSYTVKCAVWMFFALANIAMFLTILILSSEMTNLRQHAWIITLCMWLGVDSIILGLGQVVWSDVFLPSLVYDQVNFVKEAIRASREKQSEVDTFAAPSINFDMTKYFFVANRIAHYFPFLPEVDYVLNFQSSWPKTFFEKHEIIFMPHSYRGVVYDVFLQCVGLLTGLDSYVHDFFIWFFAPILIIGMCGVLSVEFLKTRLAEPLVVPDKDIQSKDVGVDVVRSYIIPTTPCKHDNSSKGLLGKFLSHGSAAMVVKDFDDISSDTLDGQPDHLFSPKSNEISSNSIKASRIHVGEKSTSSRHPLVNSESCELAKSPHRMAKTMTIPREVIKARAERNPVPRLPEARQECAKLDAKLSRLPSILPTITTDLTAFSHRYGTDRPMSPNASAAFEPVLHTTCGSLQDRGYINTPTNAKNVLRPVIVKSLPSFDVLPPMSRQGPRLVSNVSVLTPDHIDKAAKINETDPNLTADETFVVMPSFEDFFQLQNKSPLLEASMSFNARGDNESDEDKAWVDEAPDENYNFESDVDEPVKNGNVED